jgi:translation initiation factor eIF-2B subunit gamma
MDPINSNYPLTIVPIINKPLICYQLEYLQRHGVHNILVTVERKYAHKIEKYLKNHYKSVSDPAKVNIELVVFQDDEESVVALRLLAPKINGPFIAIEGNTLIDIPLDQVLDTHTLT